jgi:hypothetical protein
MRILKDLVIDEVSCVVKGASPGAKVMIRKSDVGPLFFDDIIKRDTAAQAIYDRRRRAAEAIMAALADLAEYSDETDEGDKSLTKDNPMTRPEEMQEMRKFVVTPGGMVAVAKALRGSGSPTFPEQVSSIQTWDRRRPVIQMEARRIFTKQR